MRREMSRSGTPRRSGSFRKKAPTALKRPIGSPFPRTPARRRAPRRLASGFERSSFGLHIEKLDRREVVRQEFGITSQRNFIGELEIGFQCRKVDLGSDRP